MCGVAWMARSGGWRRVARSKAHTHLRQLTPEQETQLECIQTRIRVNYNRRMIQIWILGRIRIVDSLLCIHTMTFQVATRHRDRRHRHDQLMWLSAAVVAGGSRPHLYLVSQTECNISNCSSFRQILSILIPLWVRALPSHRHLARVINKSTSFLP